MPFIHYHRGDQVECGYWFSRYNKLCAKKSHWNIISVAACVAECWVKWTDSFSWWSCVVLGDTFYIHHWSLSFIHQRPSSSSPVAMRFHNNQINCCPWKRDIRRLFCLRSSEAWSTLDPQRESSRQTGPWIFNQMRSRKPAQNSDPEYSISSAIRERETRLQFRWSSLQGIL